MIRDFGGLPPKSFRVALLLLISIFLIQISEAGSQSAEKTMDTPFDVNELVDEDTALPVRKALIGCDLISQTSRFRNDGQMALAIQLAAYDFHDSAVKVLREILDRDADFHECHYRLGYSLELSGMVDEALESFRRYLELEPNHPVTLYRIGELLNRTGEIEESNQFLNRYLKSNPNCPAAHRRVGQNLLALNKPEEALPALIVAKDQYPLDRGTLTALSQAQLRSGNREEAQKLQETLALLRSGELTETPISISDSLIQVQNKLKKSPAHCLDQAVNLETKGFYASANIYLELAAQGIPDAAAVHDRIGRNCFRLGQYAEALQSYDKSLKLEPERISALFNRASLLFGMGRVTEANQDLQSLLSVNPDHTESQILKSQIESFNKRQAQNEGVGKP